MPVELIGLDSVPIVQARAPLIAWRIDLGLFAPGSHANQELETLPHVVRSRRSLGLHPQRIRILASRTLTGIEPDQDRQANRKESDQALVVVFA